MAESKAESVYELVQGFADVMAAEEGADQRAQAVAWCEQCDAFYAQWPTETINRVATYISLALMDDDDKTLPGEVRADVLQRITAEIYAVRALASDEG